MENWIQNPIFHQESGTFFFENHGKSMEFDGKRWNTKRKTYGKPMEKSMDIPIDFDCQTVPDHPPPLPVQLWLGMLLCGCAMGEMSSPLKRNLDI
jgi:hypothetical protein